MIKVRDKVRKRCGIPLCVLCAFLGTVIWFYPFNPFNKPNLDVWDYIEIFARVLATYACFSGLVDLMIAMFRRGKI